MISVGRREDGLKFRFDATDSKFRDILFLYHDVCAVAEFPPPDRICRKCGKSRQKYRDLDPKGAHPSTVHALRKLAAWAQAGLGLYVRSLRLGYASAGIDSERFEFEACNDS